jgi:hypothetical protein
MPQRYAKKIVCLANSRKPPSGRCIAGREFTADGFGIWVRVVSDRPTHEISLEERQYPNGQDPSVLDILSIEMKSPQPHRYQQENHLIDAGWYWVKRDRMSWRRLQAAVEDPGGSLWLNGSSSHDGRNDRVAETRVDGLTRSLYLIRPQHLRLVVALEGGDFDFPRRRVRACFSLGAHAYRMAVTDPTIESDYLNRAEGEYVVGDALLCVSLGEIYHGFAYKLAATVITPDRAGA